MDHLQDFDVNRHETDQLPASQAQTLTVQQANILVQVALQKSLKEDSHDSKLQSELRVNASQLQSAFRQAASDILTFILDETVDNSLSWKASQKVEKQIALLLRNAKKILKDNGREERQRIARGQE